MNSTLNFGIPTVLVFQLEVYYKVDRLLIGLTAQQKGATARWYSNKTSLTVFFELLAKVEAARFASEAYVLGGRVIGECYGFESHYERYR